jgi:hypothetical protein
MAKREDFESGLIFMELFHAGPQAFLPIGL